MIAIDAGALTDAVIPLGVAAGVTLLCVALRTILVTRVFAGDGEQSTPVIVTRLLLDPRFFPFLAFRFLLPATYGAAPFLNKAIFFLLIAHLIVIAWRVLDILANRWFPAARRSKIARAALVAVKIDAAAVLLIFLLENVGVSVTTLLVVSGAGIALIAFAFRDSIANLAATAVIWATKPFSVGDVVSVKGARGTILSIEGMTTKVQAEDGGVLAVPNRDLITEVVTVIDTAASTVVTITVPVPRTTPTKRMEEMPALFEQAVSAMDNVSFRHATVSSVDPSTISFEVVCLVDGDQATCAAVQHNLAVQLLAALKQRSSSRPRGGVESE